MFIFQLLPPQRWAIKSPSRARQVLSVMKRVRSAVRRSLDPWGWQGQGLWESSWHVALPCAARTLMKLAGCTVTPTNRRELAKNQPFVLCSLAMAEIFFAKQHFRFPSQIAVLQETRSRQLAICTVSRQRRARMGHNCLLRLYRHKSDMLCMQLHAHVRVLK